MLPDVAVVESDHRGHVQVGTDEAGPHRHRCRARTLCQVKIEDVIETNAIFTVLMGEDVEPRREFIQENALEVSMLDI